MKKLRAKEQDSLYKRIMSKSAAGPFLMFFVIFIVVFVLIDVVKINNTRDGFIFLQPNP